MRDESCDAHDARVAHDAHAHAHEDGRGPGEPGGHGVPSAHGASEDGTWVPGPPEPASRAAAGAAGTAGSPGAVGMRFNVTSTFLQLTCLAEILHGAWKEGEEGGSPN